uniref:Uncharacterized protein n=1 Tax=Rhipicephalus zambeziensis TaxID=60191 RepID=A0A224YKK5_9ACAR
MFKRNFLLYFMNMNRVRHIYVLMSCQTKADGCHSMTYPDRNSYKNFVGCAAGQQTTNVCSTVLQITHTKYKHTTKPPHSFFFYLGHPFLLWCVLTCFFVGRSGYAC